jgi:hypothetical protein
MKAMSCHGLRMAAMRLASPPAGPVCVTGALWRRRAASGTAMY